MIKLFIIRIILFFTWFNSLGFHIRYRLKKMGFINKRVGWTITLFKSFDNPVKKNWKRIKTIGWFSIEQEKLYGYSDFFKYIKLLFDVNKLPNKTVLYWSTV